MLLAERGALGSGLGEEAGVDVSLTATALMLQGDTLHGFAGISDAPAISLASLRRTYKWLPATLRGIVLWSHCRFETELPLCYRAR
jgi:hypothetical protein